MQCTLLGTFVDPEYSMDELHQMIPVRYLRFWAVELVYLQHRLSDHYAEAWLHNQADGHQGYIWEKSLVEWMGLDDENGKHWTEWSNLILSAVSNIVKTTFALSSLIRKCLILKEEINLWMIARMDSWFKTWNLNPLVGCMNIKILECGLQDNTNWDWNVYMTTPNNSIPMSPCKQYPSFLHYTHDGNKISCDFIVEVIY